MWKNYIQNYIFRISNVENGFNPWRKTICTVSFRSPRKGNKPPKDMNSGHVKAWQIYNSNLENIKFSWHFVVGYQLMVISTLYIMYNVYKNLHFLSNIFCQMQELYLGNTVSSGFNTGCVICFNSSINISMTVMLLWYVSTILCQSGCSNWQAFTILYQ